MVKSFGQDSLPDICFAHFSVDQEIVAAAAEAFFAFVYPDCLDVFPEDEWQLSYYGQIFFGLFECLAGGEFRVHLNFHCLTIVKLCCEEVGVNGDSFSRSAIVHPSLTFAGWRQVFECRGILIGDDVFADKDGATEGGLCICRDECDTDDQDKA